MFYLANHNEMVFRSIYDKDGSLILPNAIIERTVTEKIIGVDGVMLKSDTETIMPPFVGMNRGRGADEWTGGLMSYGSQMMAYYVMNSLPIDAHVGLVEISEKKQAFHITQNTAQPRGSFMATHPDYAFVLILGHPGIQASYLFVIDKARKSAHPVMLPNTYDDCRICMGTSVDQTIRANKLYNLEANYQAWKNSGYNNHLRDSDNDMMKMFWQFEISTNKWTPNPAALSRASSSTMAARAVTAYLANPTP